MRTSIVGASVGLALLVACGHPTPPSSTDDTAPASQTAPPKIAPTDALQVLTRGLPALKVDQGSSQSEASEVACVVVDFEGIPAGALIDAVGGAAVDCAGGCIAFDTANPTGGDDDLGTPSSLYGGPGEGEGGESNDTSLGTVLILAENLDDDDGDGLVDDPDDDAQGGLITLTLPGPSRVESALLLDIDADEPGGSVMTLFGEGGAQDFVIPALGDNSVQRVGLGVDDVEAIEISLVSSGALAELTFCTSDEAPPSPGCQLPPGPLPDLEKLDVVFLFDLSGDMADEMSTIRALTTSITASLRNDYPDVWFGVSSFVDKPIAPFGQASFGDYAYKTNLPLTSSTASLQNTIGFLPTFSGLDAPEAQLEALLQVAVRPAEIGWRADSLRVVVVVTGGPFHEAGDFATAPPNDADAVLNGSPPGTGEDYPSRAATFAALDAAGIVTIFAVTADFIDLYRDLAMERGVGSAVLLSSDGSNLVTATKSGLDDCLPEIE